MTTITVKYTCHICVLIGQEINVPERQRCLHPDYWMGMAASRVAADHTQRRPHCGASSFELKAPAKNNDPEMIGRNSK